MNQPESNSELLDAKIKMLSKLGLEKDKICNRFGIEPSRVDAALGHLSRKKQGKKGWHGESKRHSIAAKKGKR